MNPTYLNTLQTSLHVTTLMDIWDIYIHGFVKHRKIFFCLCRWAFSFDTCIMHMRRFVQLLLVLTLRLLTSVPIYFNYDISGTYRLKTDKWFAGLNQNDCTCNQFAFDFIFVFDFWKLILMLFVSITCEFVWCSFISYAKKKELWMFNHSWSQSAHQNFYLHWKGGI